jgi:hypothetical protein
LPRENQPIERRYASEGVKAPENSRLPPQGSALREANAANRSSCSAATRTPFQAAQSTAGKGNGAKPGVHQENMRLKSELAG